MLIGQLMTLEVGLNNLKRNKMTAVEWLVEELQKAEYIPKDSIIMDYVIKLSKEMEKQQIENTYEVAYIDGYNDNGKDGKQYYNETFKNN